MMVSDISRFGQAATVTQEQMDQLLQDKLKEEVKAVQMKTGLIIGVTCLVVGFVIGAWFF